MFIQIFGDVCTCANKYKNTTELCKIIWRKNKQTNKLNETETKILLARCVILLCMQKGTEKMFCGIITLHIYPVCQRWLSLFRFTFVIHTETLTLIVVTLNTMNTTIAFGIDLSEIE